MRDEDCVCIDCGAEQFHENRLCANCHDRRFNDPARVLPTGEIRVQGEAPNPPVRPPPEQRTRLLQRFWDAVLSGEGYRVRQAAHGLKDRGISLETTLQEHLTRIEEPLHRQMREAGLSIFAPAPRPA